VLEAQVVVVQAALTMSQLLLAMQTLGEVAALVEVVKEHIPQKRVAQAL
jgi:hypothetical protein